MPKEDNMIFPSFHGHKVKLVNQSRLALQEAKAILGKAKRAVEIAIEESEDKAIGFIV